MKLLAGNSNTAFAQSVADNLGIPLVNARLERFPDNEVFVTINENVRGQDIFLIQSTSYPANDNLMEMLICIDAVSRSSARSITAVMPYYGYARQDRKTSGRTPISAKLVANLIQAAGATRMIAMDLHASQIQGFFDIPMDHLTAFPVFAQDIKLRYRDQAAGPVIVSPDMGGVVRARQLADRIQAGLVIVDKRRIAPGESEVMNIIGEVRDRDCIIIDDIIDSGGTLCNAADALLMAGARSASAMISHGVLSGSACERISSSSLHEVVVTDSINIHTKMAKCKKLRQITVAPLIAEAIRRIDNCESVSKLFD